MDFASTATIRTIIDMKLHEAAEICGILRGYKKGFAEQALNPALPPQQLKTNPKWENTLEFKAFSIHAPNDGRG